MQAALLVRSVQPSNGASASSDQAGSGRSATDSQAPGRDPSALTGLQEPILSTRACAAAGHAAATAEGIDGGPRAADGAATVPSSARAHGSRVAADRKCG